MLPTPEQGPRGNKEVIFNEYGIYIVTKSDAKPWEGATENEKTDKDSVVILSQPDWDKTRTAIQESTFGDATVLTPELITIAGLPFSEIASSKSTITRELDDIRDISKTNPGTTYIIGSPFFLDGVQKPYNAAVSYKNGRIVHATFKKILDEEERGAFSFSPGMTPLPMGESTVLVCRDLIGAQKTRLTGGKNGVADYIQRATNNEALAKYYGGAEFLANESKKILLSACWGVGVNPEAARIFKDGSIDMYYLMNLRSMASALLRMDPHLEQVIVSDRAPIGNEGNVAKKPMSGVFFK